MPGIISRQFIWLTCAVSLASYCFSRAQAQPSPPQNKPWGLNINRQSEGFTGQILKDVPDLPKLPAYSGKTKFLRGRVYTNDRGWVVYNINSLSKEEPSEIIQWYQSAFNMYQWKTLHVSRQNIGADQKDGTFCNVTLNSTNEPGYHTRISISYTLPPPPTVKSNQN